MASYGAPIRWRRQPNELFTDSRYRRAHQWIFDGGAKVWASASPLHVPAPLADPAGIDPEEAFVAALSSCHMLFFLWHAATKGWVVESYEDQAFGTMSRRADGREWVSPVTFAPRVTFEEEGPSLEEVEAPHHASHAACFLANSVKTEIVVEGSTAVQKE